MNITADFLRMIGDRYVSAVDSGLAPNVQIANEFGVSRRTAERWVYVARKAGHIAPVARMGRISGRPRCPACDQIIKV